MWLMRQSQSSHDLEISCPFISTAPHNAFHSREHEDPDQTASSDFLDDYLIMISLKGEVYGIDEKEVHTSSMVLIEGIKKQKVFYKLQHMDQMKERVPIVM